MSKMSELYPQYYKDVTDLTEADVYRICDLFEVGKRDPSGATHHAIKKLLLPGVRTGGKTVEDDVKEARNTLTRRLDMWAEDRANADKRRKNLKDTFDTTGASLGNPVPPMLDRTLDLIRDSRLGQDLISAAQNQPPFVVDGGQVFMRRVSLKPVTALATNGIPYYGGYAAVEKGSDTEMLAAMGIELKEFDVTGGLWVRARAEDTILTFCQRHGLRPYELREMNQFLADRDMYDGVGGMRLQIK